MMISLFFTSLALFSFIGVFWLFLREKALYKEYLLRYTLAEKKLKDLEKVELELRQKELEIVHLKTKLGFSEEKLSFIQGSQEKLKETFQALSFEALEKTQRSFIDLAQERFERLQQKTQMDLNAKEKLIAELVAPVKETLGKIDGDLRALEKERKGERESLRVQIDSLISMEKALRDETGNLAKALRSPSTRGRWGEIQLKRVVELAGMLDHCDFYEQAVNEESRFRPDLIVRLPGDRQVIIDAKAPMQAYLEAISLSDEKAKELKLKEHAKQVRAHISMLSKKGYAEKFQPTPEFVVMFLPSETFFSAALEYDPSLIEIGVEDGVILATPTTLIALLRGVAYGWKQENLSRHVAYVSELGHELYKRLVDMSSHFSKIGRNLSSAVDSYNKTVGSLESRVLVTARKFKNLGAAASSMDLDLVSPIEQTTRSLQAFECSSETKLEYTGDSLNT